MAHRAKTGLWGIGTAAIMAASTGCVHTDSSRFDPDAHTAANSLIIDTEQKTVDAGTVRQAFLTDGVKATDRFMASLLILDTLVNHGRLPPAAYMQGLDQAVTEQYDALPELIRDNIDYEYRPGKKLFFQQPTPDDWKKYEKAAKDFKQWSIDISKEPEDSSRIVLLRDTCHLVKRSMIVALASDFGLTLKLLPRVSKLADEYDSKYARVIMYVAHGIDKNVKKVIKPDEQEMGFTYDQYKVFALSSVTYDACELHVRNVNNPMIRNYIQSEAYSGGVTFPTTPGCQISNQFQLSESGLIVTYKKDPAATEPSDKTDIVTMESGVREIGFSAAAVQKSLPEIRQITATVLSAYTYARIIGYQYLDGYNTVPEPVSAIDNPQAVSNLVAESAQKTAEPVSAPPPAKKSGASWLHSIYDRVRSKER